MAEFKINGHMKVKTLKELFFNEFEGTLRVYDGKKLADDEATLASIRSNEGAKGGELSCRASRTVGKFEQEMWDVFGIKVQVATKDNWVLVLDGITLSKIKDIPNYAKKETMEEFLSYQRKNEPLLKESSNLKKYTIKISTKGAHDIMCGLIDIADGANAEEVLDCITSDDIDNWDFEPHDGLESSINIEYIGSQCIGDEYESPFELEVLDNEENVVFTTDNFYDLKMVHPNSFLENIEDYYENEDEKPNDELLQRMQKVMLEQYEKDAKRIHEGYYVLVIDEMKWQYMEFEIEDDEFNPNKLLFISNPNLEGACFDSYTDPCHVMYGDKILENLVDEGGDDYGFTRYLAKRNKDWFEIIRELD